MTHTAVVRRYAQALYEEAVREHQVHTDVALISDTLAGSRDLLLLLQSPVVPRTKKSAVLQRLFGQRVHALTMRFVQLLVRRGRESVLPSIIQRYGELSDESAGRTRVAAQVAHPVLDDMKASLTRALEKKLQRSVQLSVAENPDLLGGIMLRIGDTVYDGSVLHQLALMRSRMHV